MNDHVSFLRQWAASPLKVAAIAPSGKRLGRLMTEGLDATTAPVIELGPGTGVFTEAMIARGVPEDRIALVELNEAFAHGLSAKFPQAQMHNVSATGLSGRSFFSEPAQAVVSGLGLLAMPEEDVALILQGAFEHLATGGHFIQFTYGPKCPVPETVLRSLGLKATRVSGTWRNLPPASVYHIARGEV